MKKILALFAVMVVLSACSQGQQGVDEAAAKFKGATVTLGTGKSFKISAADQGGVSTVTEQDSSGKEVQSVDGKVTVVDGVLTLTVTLEGGTSLILTGNMDDSGSLTNISLKIDGQKMAVANVNDNVPSAGSIYVPSEEMPEWLTGAWCYSSGTHDKDSVRSMIFLGKSYRTGIISVSCFKSPDKAVPGRIFSPRSDFELKQGEYFPIDFEPLSFAGNEDICAGGIVVKVNADGTMQAFISQGNLVIYKKSSLANITEATKMEQACPTAAAASPTS